METKITIIIFLVYLISSPFIFADSNLYQSGACPVKYNYLFHGARAIRGSFFEEKLPEEKLLHLIEKIKNRPPVQGPKISPNEVRFFLFHKYTILFKRGVPIGIINGDFRNISRQDFREGTYSIYYVSGKEEYYRWKMFFALTEIEGSHYEIIKPFAEEPKSAEFWNKVAVDTQSLSSMDEKEELIRKKSIGWLKDLGFKDGILYDVMCSSGAFLEAINEKFPEADLYGSDSSGKMVNYARQRLKGKGNINIFKWNALDSLPPVLKPLSVDVLVFRGLIESVVDKREAKLIFKNHIPLLHPGSIVIVTGITNVLLSSSFFRENGFQILNMSNFSKSSLEFHQFYVLKYKKKKN